MTEGYEERFQEVKERQMRLEKARRRREALLKRRSELERQIPGYELQLAAEEADVDKLTRMSLANLFHTILRSKEEQLELERQQALAAALKLQEAREALAGIESELVRVGDDLSACGGADREFERLMAEKEAALRNSPASAAELAAMDERIASQTVLAREIAEAASAGASVLASLEDASASLEKAENWGKWDTWGGGGMISTHLKHGHVDDARRSVHAANRLMQTFRDELADLERSVDIRIDISGGLKMADYWFDGLITDWVVQGRIKRAQEQTLDAIHEVRAVVRQLQSERSSAETELAGLRSGRAAWIERKRVEGDD